MIYRDRASTVRFCCTASFLTRICPLGRRLRTSKAAGRHKMTSPHSSTDEKKAHYDSAATDAEVAIGQVNDYDEGEVFRKASQQMVHARC